MVIFIQSWMFHTELLISSAQSTEVFNGQRIRPRVGMYVRHVQELCQQISLLRREQRPVEQLHTQVIVVLTDSRVAGPHHNGMWGGRE